MRFSAPVHNGTPTQQIVTIPSDLRKSSNSSIRYKGFNRLMSVPMADMWVFLVLLLSCSIVESRVTFASSEILDNVDLKGTNTASFRCSSGCRVYSPTKNDNIVIVDGAGKEGFSLQKLSTLKTGESYQLQPNTGPYQLKNKGVPNPSFVFYVAEKGAKNFFTNVVYVDGTTSANLTAKYDEMYTILSSSGSVRFSNFGGNYKDALPSVYATGFDSASTCRPVYTASSPSLALKSSFAVYSPIATIDFKLTGDKTVVVSGESTQSSLVKDTSAVFVSPGYVGCPSVGNSLYTFVSSIARIDANLSATYSSVVSVGINGDYSIANQADAIALTVNNDAMKLFGKNSISKRYDGTKFNIKLAWAKKEGSKDALAMQIDIASK